MNPVWLVPLAALLIGGAAIVALVRSAAEEATLLADELGRQRDVVDSLGRLRVAMSDLGQYVPRR